MQRCFNGKFAISSQATPFRCVEYVLLLQHHNCYLMPALMFVKWCHLACRTRLYYLVDWATCVNFPWYQLPSYRWSPFHSLWRQITLRYIPLVLEITTTLFVCPLLTQFQRICLLLIDWVLSFLQFMSYSYSCVASYSLWTVLATGV